MTIWWWPFTFSMLSLWNANCMYYCYIIWNIKINFTFSLNDINKSSLIIVARWLTKTITSLRLILYFIIPEMFSIFSATFFVASSAISCTKNFFFLLVGSNGASCKAQDPHEYISQTNGNKIFEISTWIEPKWHCFHWRIWFQRLELKRYLIKQFYVRIKTWWNIQNIKHTCLQHKLSPADVQLPLHSTQF